MIEFKELKSILDFYSSTLEYDELTYVTDMDIDDLSWYGILEDCSEQLHIVFNNDDNLDLIPGYTRVGHLLDIINKKLDNHDHRS